MDSSLSWLTTEPQPGDEPDASARQEQPSFATAAPNHDRACKLASDAGEVDDDQLALPHLVNKEVTACLQQMQGARELRYGIHCTGAIGSSTLAMKGGPDATAVAVGCLPALTVVVRLGLDTTQ